MRNGFHVSESKLAAWPANSPYLNEIQKCWHAMSNRTQNKNSAKKKMAL